MASRWAYEALVVYQFKNNSYEKPYYDFEKIESQADFRSSFLAAELDKKREFIADNIGTGSDSIKQIMQKDLGIIQAVLQDDYFKRGLENELANVWTLNKFTTQFNAKLKAFLEAYKKFYQHAYNKAIAEREGSMLKNEQQNDYSLNAYKNNYYNESLADLVRNISEKDRLVEYKGRLIQQINPVFLDPKATGAFDYRAHLFAPQKNLLGFAVTTFLFNNLIIWIMTALLYIALYFELLRKSINAVDELTVRTNLTKRGRSK